MLREGLKKIWNFGLTHPPFFYFISHCQLYLMIKNAGSWIPYIFLLLNPILVIHSPEDYVAYVLRQNLASKEAKIWLPKRSFIIFWDFQWWKYVFYKKCSKNSLVLEKKNKWGGGGDFEILFFKFTFWNSQPLKKLINKKLPTFSNVH